MLRKPLPALVAICGPPAVGKTTLIRESISHWAHAHRFGTAPSHTTRPPRDGERPGDYVFVSEDEFQRLADKRDFFVEESTVHGHRFGLSWRSLDDCSGRGLFPIVSLSVGGVSRLSDFAAENGVCLTSEQVTVARFSSGQQPRGDHRQGSHIDSGGASLFPSRIISHGLHGSQSDRSPGKSYPGHQVSGADDDDVSRSGIGIDGEDETLGAVFGTGQASPPPPAMMRVLLSPPPQNDLRLRLSERGEKETADMLRHGSWEAREAIAKPGLWEAVLSPGEKAEVVYRWRGLLASFVQNADALARGAGA